MSYPFMIWTMQRTGGTELTDLLMSISEHPGADQDPFTWQRGKSRQFGQIFKDWNDSGNGTRLGRSLGKIFSEQYLIKHCYELHPASFNENLIRAVAKTPYRHIHLLRRDEASRLISKYIAITQKSQAREQGRQGLPSVDKIVEYYYRSQEQIQAISALLRDVGVRFIDVYSEDIFNNGLEKGWSSIETLLLHLDFTPTEIEQHRPAIEEVLRNTSNVRSSRKVMPDVRAALEALYAAGCPPSAEYRLEEMLEDGSDAEITPGSGPQHRQAEILRELAVVHGARGPVLEVGVRAGTPAVSLPCAMEGWHVLTPDPSLVVHGATMHYGDATTMPAEFENGRFGTVISNGTLAQDNLLPHTLDEMKRVLAPGGLLLVGVPGFSKAADQIGTQVLRANRNQVANATITQTLQGTHDYWRFSPPAMRHVVLAGLEIIDIREAMMPPRIFGVGRKSVS